MTRLRVAAVAVAVGLGAVLVPLVAVAAAPDVGDTQNTLDRLSGQWRHGPVATSSTKWKTFPMEGSTTGLLLGNARGSMSITLSVNIGGARVQFRVLDNGKVAKPGVAAFAPRRYDTSRSFTFLSTGTVAAACHTERLQWRSPSGASARVNRADLVVHYHFVSGGGCAG